MTTLQHLPPALTRRLRATSTEGITHRRWWDEHLAGVTTPVPPRPAGRVESVVVPLDRATAARLDATADRIPARRLALLTAIAALAVAAPGQSAIVVRIPGPLGARLPVRLDLRPAESRADLVFRALSTVLSAARAADGAPDDAVAAIEVSLAPWPIDGPADDGPADHEVTVLLAEWPDAGAGHDPATTAGGPVLRVRAAQPGELAARVAAVAAELVEHPQYPAVSLVRDPQDVPIRADGEAAESPSLLATLAAIWQDLLEVDLVDPADDFFDLGGHSLLALELVAEIRDRITESVTMSDVFEAPTLSGLAARLSRLS
jgi:acyl carrier protein